MTCAGVATAALVVGVVSLVRTLEEVRLTAQQARKTAAAVEQLASHVDESARAVGGITKKVDEIAQSLSFNWLRGMQFAVTAFQALRERWAAAEESEKTPSPDPDV